MRTEGRWVHMGAPLASMGSSGIGVFTRLLPVCCWVHPGLLGSRGCALGEFRFMRGHWVHSGAPWWSLG